jgi:hypothetical protein
LNGKEFTEVEFVSQRETRLTKATCEGKVVEIDGVKYRLVKDK